MKKRIIRYVLICLLAALLFISVSCNRSNGEETTMNNDTTEAVQSDTEGEDDVPETPPSFSRDLLTFTPASPGKQVLTEKGASPQILITNYNETATDALGRALPTSEEAGLPKEGKYVGLFYLIWTTGATCDHDNSKALAVNPYDPDFGPRWGFCWWSEPETGYHRADDVWQIKRDMYYFAMAGVDFLYIDFTNGYLYEDTFKIFLDTCLELRAAGQMTPYIVPWGFGTSVEGRGDIGKVYKLFMTDEKYSDLWFCWEGKPLAMIKPADDGSFPILDDEYYKDKLTFRKSWVSPDKYSEMYWEDNRIVNFGYGYGWVENDKTAECTGIGCAGFANFGAGRSGSKSAKNYLNAFLETDTMGKGTVFETAFKQLMKKNPECQVLLISRWNEWVAQNFTNPADKGTDTGFVDQFNPEFSRDIEPMKGGFTDNYFYQMCSIIRRFKGVLPADGASGAHTMKDTDGKAFEKWENIYPVYTDFEGDTSRRDHTDTTGKIRYVNDTGRNDIVEARITADKANVYFYVRTAKDMTPYKDSPNWMLLFIDADNDKSTGWEGYDYLINYEVISDTVTAVCRYVDGVWQETGTVSYAVRGDRMTVTVPRLLLGLTGGPVNVNFHWLDNVTDIYSLESWFTTGDSAPERRNDYAARLDIAYTGDGEDILPKRDNGIRGMRGTVMTDTDKAKLQKGLLLSLYPLPGDYPAQPDFRLIDSLFSGCTATDKLSSDALPEGNIGAVFEGYFNAVESKKYDFEITCSGGVRLYIDGRLVADGPYDPKSTDKTKTAKGSIILEKGYHKIRAEYAECRGEKPVLSFGGDCEFSYITPEEGLTEFPAWEVDFSTMKDQIAYSEEGAPAGIFDPYLYLKYGYTAYLGKVDLSKFSRVEIVYCCDGSDITRQRFESSSSLAIGLKSEDSTYGSDKTDNFDGDIAHTDMVFSDKMWATGKRIATVDLSDITYSGDVWLALHNPAGTFIGILEIKFYA